MFFSDRQRGAWLYERYRLSDWFISRSPSAVAAAAVAGVSIVLSHGIHEVGFFPHLRCCNESTSRKP
jgi:hypothetical protein